MLKKLGLVIYSFTNIKEYYSIIAEMYFWFELQQVLPEIQVFEIGLARFPNTLC